MLGISDFVIFHFLGHEEAAAGGNEHSVSYDIEGSEMVGHDLQGEGNDNPPKLKRAPSQRPRFLGG